MSNPCFKHTTLNVTPLPPPPQYEKYTPAQKLLPLVVLLFAWAQNILAPAPKSLNIILKFRDLGANASFELGQKVISLAAEVFAPGQKVISLAAEVFAPAYILFVMGGGGGDVKGCCLTQGLLTLPPLVNGS